jgi:hypothetical protein
MQTQKPSSRTGAIISLVGAALALLGSFLPLLAGPASEAGYSEWLLLIDRWQLFLFPISHALFILLFFGLLALLLTLPLLSALVVLGTSISAWFKSPSPRLLTLQRLAAIIGLFIQSVAGIIVLGNAGGGETIGLGLILLLLGFLLTVVGAFLSKLPRPTSEQKPVSPPSQPPRIGAILSLLGSAVVICGVFFFPMFIVSGGSGNVNNTSSPWYEWSLVVKALFHESLVALRLGAVLFALPLLSVLFVLATSVAKFFQELSPGTVIWRRIAAIAGLVIQSLLGVFTLVIYSISLVVDFSTGFGLVLIGFIVMIVGTFLN